MAIVGSNFISGITTFLASTDVVNKDYVDQKSESSLPPQNGNSGKYLITTDGTSVSWENISKSQDFSSVGIHTFVAPVSSSLLYIEATGGGGGGSVGGFVGNTNIGIKWYARSTPYYQGSPLVRPNTLPPGGTSSPLKEYRSAIEDMTTFGDIKLAYSPDQNVFVGIFKRDLLTHLSLAVPPAPYTHLADYDFWPPPEMGIIRSTDGIIWSIIPSPVSPQAQTKQEDAAGVFSPAPNTQIIYAGGKFVGFISSRALFYSTDGISWQVDSQPLGIGNMTSGRYSLGYGNGIYLSGGNDGNDASRWNARGTLETSTDLIHWVNRFNPAAAGPTGVAVKHFIYGNSGYMLFTIDGEAKHSTDAIVWTLRTCGFKYNGPSFIRPDYPVARPTLGSSQGIYSKNNYLAIVPSLGCIIGSTDSIVWTIRTSPATTSNITPLVELGNYGILMPPNIFSTDGIVWIQSGTVEGYSQENAFDFQSQTYYPQYDGRSVYIGAGTSTNYGIYVSDIIGASYGGSGGSYSSWYVPKSIVSSNITVNVGSGGEGSTTEGVVGNPGAGTTISWTGPGGGTIYLTSPGGQSPFPGAGQTNGHFYITSGAPGSYEPSGNGGSQINKFQPSGGGAGSAQTSTSGGSGGTIDICGFTSTVSGGTPSSIDGNTGVAYPQIVPYGNGGGGGGSNVSSAGRGGNGVLGGGGGGGASIGSTFGFGGNGGDGYARITWV